MPLRPIHEIHALKRDQGPPRRLCRSRAPLVTISIDRASTLPGLREELAAPKEVDQQERLARLLGMGGVGVRLVGEQTPERLAACGRAFRGDA